MIMGGAFALGGVMPPPHGSKTIYVRAERVSFAMRREHAEHSPLRGLINEKGGTAAAR